MIKPPIHTIKHFYFQGQLPFFRYVLQKKEKKEKENKSSGSSIINKAGQKGARVTVMLIIHRLVAPLSTPAPLRMLLQTPELICYDLYLCLCVTAPWMRASCLTVSRYG